MLCLASSTGCPPYGGKAIFIDNRLPWGGRVMARAALKFLSAPMEAVDALGTHLLVDLWGASPDLLDDAEFIRETLADAVRAGDATLIDVCVHQFAPYGITATATLSESHICIHTWPEYGYAAIDIFMCGKGDPHKALAWIQKKFGTHSAKVREMKRGVFKEET